MQEIVLKRTASVTSAEALDQINEAYPDAEILSFRRIKEAGNDSEFFVARLRVAEALEDDVVVEGKQHEEEEEEMMREMLRLLKKLVKDEDKEESPNKDAVLNEKDFQDEEPIGSGLDDLVDDHERKPLPQPQQAPYGVAGLGSDIVPKAASITVERSANVPASVARVELLREFADEYKIASLEKVGNVYRANLVKRSADEWGGAEVNDPLTYDPKSKPREKRLMAPDQDVIDAANQMAEQDPIMGDVSATEDPFGIAYEVTPPRFIDRNALSDEAYAWLKWLHGQGYDYSVLNSEQNILMSMNEDEQREYLQQYVSSPERRDVTRQEQYEEKMKPYYEETKPQYREDVLKNRPIEKKFREDVKDLRENMMDDIVNLIQQSDIKSLAQLKDLSTEELVDYLSKMDQDKRLELHKILKENSPEGYSSVDLGLEMPEKIEKPKKPAMDPSVSDVFGKEPLAEDRNRTRRRINIPSEKLKEWGGGKTQMGDDSKTFYLNKNVDIEGARQQIEDYFMSQVINPEDKKEVAEAKSLAEKEMSKILGPNNRRIRKADPKKQQKWLDQQIRQVVGEDPSEKAIDPTVPLVESYRENHYKMHPMQIADIYKKQLGLGKAKRIRDKAAPSVTEQETQRPPTRVYPAKGGQS